MRRRGSIASPIAHRERKVPTYSIAVVGFESPNGQRLAARLNVLGSIRVIEFPDTEALLQRCRVVQVDLIMCHLPADIGPYRSLLRELAALPAPPALAFFGSDTDLGYLETSCLHFGLCYLGFFGGLVGDTRLRRLMDQLKVYAEGAAR